jgi:hypothetical protein
MENKQTAVEWLWNESQSRELQASDFEKALEMEKEQIEDAFLDGKWDWKEHIKDGKLSKDIAQYYNETYKKDNNES